MSMWLAGKRPGSAPPLTLEERIERAKRYRAEIHSDLVMFGETANGNAEWLYWNNEVEYLEGRLRENNGKSGNG